LTKCLSGSFAGDGMIRFCRDGEEWFTSAHEWSGRKAPWQEAIGLGKKGGRLEVSLPFETGRVGIRDQLDC